jgi:hypothetical protein
VKQLRLIQTFAGPISPDGLGCEAMIQCGFA